MSFGTRAVFFLVVVASFSLASVAASNETKIHWDDFTEADRKSDLQTEFDDKGLQPWFDLAVSFANTVLNKEPYGRFRDMSHLRKFTSKARTTGSSKLTFYC